MSQSLSFAPAAPTGPAVTGAQRRSALIAGLLPALLGCVLLAAGLHFRASAKAGAQTVAIERVLDRTAVPSGSYVTVRGTPSGLTETYGGVDGWLLFTLREQPKLIAVCPKVDDGCQASALQGARELTGRLHDGLHEAGPNPMPLLALDQLARQQGLGEATVRVLNLGEKPAGDASSAMIAFGFGGVLLVLGLGLCALVAAGVLPKPRRSP